MTKYYVFYCSNGFCGCDEDFYKKVDEKENLDALAEDILFNEYSFAEPDERYMDMDEEDAYDNYKENNLDVWYKEISKGEYDANVG